MNSEYHKGKALLDSLTVLEELTKTTTLIGSTKEQGNSDTTDNPHQLLQDLKVCYTLNQQRSFANLFYRKTATQLIRGLNGD